ncbi:MAG TPA: SDR family oxidoreductase [Bacteroidia bacterium]|jgi:NAD(P)-dependent dehydrogenase (short-subunit alcohol dehydrogenase family)|nr:SDR family oxidoreductase [Bacteroidia bacterium]
MSKTPFHLDNKKILVTGATGGIGRQTALSIVEMGGEVFISGRDEKKLEELAKELKTGKDHFVSADLTTDEGRKKLIASVGQLDGLVHCPGYVSPFPVKFMTEQKMADTMKINFEAPVLVTGMLLKEKKFSDHSSLVYLSSISSHRPQRGAAMYGGSKAALESFVKVLAQELSAQKIRVNTISPAMVRTPMYDRAEEMVSKEEMDKHISKYLIGVGEPADVANAAIYLLSSASKWVTGINLILDGGILL